MKNEFLEIDDIRVIITYHDASSSLLNEAKTKGAPLVGTYSAIKHKPHTQPGEYHLHVYDGKDQIFAINHSGSAHDGFHSVRIPNKVYQALSAKYKEWMFPPNQIIESIHYTYFLNPIEDLTYRDLIYESKIIQSEMNFFDRVKKANLNESINLSKIDSQQEKFLKRFQSLMIESIKRIS